MKYLVASLFAALQLLGFIYLAGAGHGWLAGAFSCLPLAPHLIRRVVQCTPRRAITFYLQLPARRRWPGARGDCICNAIREHRPFPCVLAGARYFSRSDHCSPLLQLDTRLRADLVALSCEQLMI